MVTTGKIIGIIQCRMTSTRLPAKAMLDLGGETLLDRVLLRAKKSNFLDEIWIATSIDKENDIIEKHLKDTGCNIFRGSRDDVLKRFCGCIKEATADYVVRITADNPFTETKFIDLGIAYMLVNDCDYVSFKNIPYGSGVEVIKADALIRVDQKPATNEDREHVTKYILNNQHSFNVQIIEPPWEDLKRPDIRATIDTIEDYLRIKEFYSLCQQNDSLNNYIHFIDNYKKWK